MGRRRGDHRLRGSGEGRSRVAGLGEDRARLGHGQLLNLLLGRREEGRRHAHDHLVQRQHEPVDRELPGEVVGRAGKYVQGHLIQDIGGRYPDLAALKLGRDGLPVEGELTVRNAAGDALHRAGQQARRQSVQHHAGGEPQGLKMCLGRDRLDGCARLLRRRLGDRDLLNGWRSFGHLGFRGAIRHDRRLGYDRRLVGHGDNLGHLGSRRFVRHNRRLSDGWRLVNLSGRLVGLRQHGLGHDGHPGSRRHDLLRLGGSAGLRRAQHGRRPLGLRRRGLDGLLLLLRRGVRDSDRGDPLVVVVGHELLQEFVATHGRGSGRLRCGLRYKCRRHLGLRLRPPGASDGHTAEVVDRRPDAENLDHGRGDVPGPTAAEPGQEGASPGLGGLRPSTDG